jgi:hypothetical protein
MIIITSEINSLNPCYSSIAWKSATIFNCGVCLLQSLAIRDNLWSMTDNQTISPFAAAVYKPDTSDRMALLKFVEKQKSLNIRVGGVLQEALFNSEGEIVGLNWWWRNSAS